MVGLGAAAAGGQAVRRDRRRRGAGLRRPVVAGSAGGAEGRGRPAACTCSPTRGSGCSPGSVDRRPGWCRSSLDQNLRNTRQIAEQLLDAGARSGCARGRRRAGDPFVECAAGEALDVADDQVDVLLEAGWRPEDVALLTTGSRHPEQKARQAAGPDAYWDTFWDQEQVFYGHVLGFKGLERPAVILALNEAEPAERSRETAVRRAVPGPRPARRGGGPRVRRGGRGPAGAASPALALTSPTRGRHRRLSPGRDRLAAGRALDLVDRRAGPAVGAAVLTDPVHAAHRGRGGVHGPELG